MVEKKKERSYDVTVRYRDGGLDDFYGVKSARIISSVLEIIDSTSATIYLILGTVTHIRIVEVKE